MSKSTVHQCHCPQCLQNSDPPGNGQHYQVNLLMSRLDEQQRRWYAAVESSRIGHGGDTLLSLITGLDEKTIQKGREEMAALLEGRPPDRVRLPGGGRPRVEKKHLRL
jgi:hypothetical protein